MARTLVFTAVAGTFAALLLAGLPAGAQPAAESAPPLEVAGLWRIDQARTEPLYDRRRARLHFGADGRLGGHTGCNTLAAAYTLDGTRLTVGQVTLSRATCSALQLDQEDRILTALELATSARVRSDGLLELRDAEGRGVLRGTRFEAAD